jgi:lipopolysaccharide biosynthesis glycosyltransferase
LHILLTFDAKMLGPAAVCLKSLDLAHQGEHVVVHLLHSQFRQKDQRRLEDFCAGLSLETRLTTIDTKDLRGPFSLVPGAGLPIAALFRLLLARYLPENIDRLLYLDSDAVVQSSLKPLFETELGDKTVAACGNEESHLAELGIGPDTYFNSGVMLIDMKHWRNRDVEGRSLEALRTHPEKMRFMDQCALNIALAGDVVYLPRKYNHIFDQFKRMTEFEIPVVIHYAGFIKPWQNPFCNPWSGAYIEMAGMTPWPVSAQKVKELNVPLLRAFRRRVLKAVGLRKKN